jgi:hypothetical protein
MEINEIASQAIYALSPPPRTAKAPEAESTLAQMLAQSESASTNGGSDTFEVRSGILRFDLNRLRETQTALNTEQARSTVYQTAQAGLSGIQAIIEEMQTLMSAVQEGGYSEEQRTEVQNMLETSAMRINDIAGQTRFRNQPLLTGETIRITTNPLTHGGFDVLIPQIDSSSLGLANLDVMNTASWETTSRALSDALSTVSSAQTAIAGPMQASQTSLENLIGTLANAFSRMTSHETLNAPAETRWLEGASPAASISVESLRSLLPSTNLTIESVATFLK